MTDKSNFHRIPITMPKDMVAYLADKSMQAKRSGGRKLASTVIVRAAVRFLMSSGADLSGCRDEEDIIEALRKCHV